MYLDKSIVAMLLADCLEKTKVKFPRWFNYDAIFAQWLPENASGSSRPFLGLLYNNRTQLSKELDKLAQVVRTVFRIDADRLTMRRKITAMYAAANNYEQYPLRINYRIEGTKIHAAWLVPEFMLEIVSANTIELRDGGKWLTCSETDPNFRKLKAKLDKYSGKICIIDPIANKVTPVTTAIDFLSIAY